MQRTETYCDSCNRAKGETDNWFRLAVQRKYKLFSNYDTVFGDIEDIETLDICGQDCLITEISKVIS